MKPWLFILVLLLGVGAGLPALAEPDPIPPAEFFLEQYFFSYDPDFGAFGEMPFKVTDLIIGRKGNFRADWHVDIQTLSRLMARHPELPARLESGAAFRKKVYDTLLGAIPHNLEEAGIPSSHTESALKSYLAALNEHRQEEKRRSLLEAETLAYEKIRVSQGYPAGSGVGTWRVEDQRAHQFLVETLREEVIHRPWDSEFLPPAKFQAWQKSTVAALGPLLRAIPLNKSTDAFGFKLPLDFRNAYEQCIHDYRRVANRVVGSADSTDAGQKKLLSNLHGWAANEAKEQENIKVEKVGTGDYGNFPGEPDWAADRKWIADLLWWEYREQAELKTPAEDERRQKVIEKFAERRVAITNGSKYSGKYADEGVTPTRGGVFPGLEEGHAARVFPANPMAVFDSRDRFGWGESLGREAPVEFHYGKAADWDPEVATVYEGNPSGKKAFSLHPASQFLPVDGVVNLPRPEGHHVSVEVRQSGKKLDPNEFELMEMPDGLVFLRLKNGSAAAVRLDLTYTKAGDAKLAFSRNLTKLPRLTDREIDNLEIVATKLKAIGENFVSAGFLSLVDGHRARKVKVTPLQITEVMAQQTLYSYVPARLDERAPELEGFRPFLNVDGKLCYQCSGAADLLRLVLGRTLVDHPEWRVRSRSAIVRDAGSSQLRAEDFHRWTGLEKGAERFILDSTPGDMDPRSKKSDLRVPAAVRRSAEAMSELFAKPPPSAAHRGNQSPARHRELEADRERRSQSPAVELEVPEVPALENPKLEYHEGPGRKPSLLPEWTEPFRAMVAKAGNWLRSRFARPVPPTPEVTEERETPPEAVAAEPPPKPPPVSPESIEHPMARLAAEEMDNGLRRKIYAELQVRAAANAARRRNLQKVERRIASLVLELENVHERPLRETLGLPHQIALDRARKLREALEKPGGEIPDLSAARDQIDEMVRFFHDPAKRFPPDRVREKYFSYGVVIATQELAKEMADAKWTPFQSESISDIKRDLLTRPTGDTSATTGICHTVHTLAP